MKKKIVTALFLIIAGGFGFAPRSGWAEPVSVTLSADYGKYIDVYDVWPAGNGGQGYMLVEGSNALNECRGLAHFDLSAIPANGQILSATLTQNFGYYTGPLSSNTIFIERVIEGWTTSVQWPGPVVSTLDNSAGVNMPGGIGWSTSTVEIPVTELVQKWVNGTNPNYGLRVRLEDLATDRAYQWGAVPAIIITYEIPPVPISAQEYHTWLFSPITSPTLPGFGCWSNGMTGKLRPGSSWRRDNVNCSYPYIGPYSDGDQRVVDWQLGQARNCGLTTLFVSIVPEYNLGWTFFNEAEFVRVLDRAEAMGYPVAVMDDSYFRAPAAQSPENVVPRITEFLSRYKSRAGFAKIDGRPIYLLDQDFSFLNAGEIDAMLAAIEANVGDVFWVLTERGDLAKLLTVSRADAIKGANSLYHNYFSLLNHENGDWDPARYRVDQAAFVSACHQAGKKAWVWVYPGFDNRGSWGGSAADCLRMDHRGGSVLRDSLAISRDNGADHIVVSSWSCYMENTQLEATWWDEGFGSTDPFAWQKIVAEVAEKAWTAPPLPDPVVVDPYLHKKIFGIDKNGPMIQQVVIQNGELTVTVVDENSAIAKVDLWINGSIYALATAEGFRTKGLSLPSYVGTPTLVNGILSAAFNGPLRVTVSLPASKEAWVFAVAPDIENNEVSLMPPCNPQTYTYETTREVFTAQWTSQLLNQVPVKIVDQPHFWFSLSTTQRIQAGGIYHLVSILHPSDPSMTLNTPWQTSDNGKTAVFKVRLPSAVTEGDFLFLAGWDVNGNRGEPFHWEVQNGQMTILGDANSDRKVDVRDLGILAVNYGLTGGASWGQGDFNRDGKVDVSDLGILAANYGAGTGGALDFIHDAEVLGLNVDENLIEKNDGAGVPSILNCHELGLGLIGGLYLILFCPSGLPITNN